MVAGGRGAESARPRRAGGLTLRSPLLWAWVGVWLVTRAFVLAKVGYFNSHLAEINYEDVHQFQVWAEAIAHVGHLPSEEAWQYPWGAAFLMMVPRIFGGGYGETFVIMMLALDVVALGALYALGRRRGSYAGVWIWLLGVPLLNTLAVLRFDLAPTVAAVVALALLKVRPSWFGAIAGVGFTLKLWPLAALFAEWDRQRLVRAAFWFLVAVAVTLLAAAVWWGDPFTFLSAQGGRGLQVESVAALPWQLREVFTGTEVPEALRYGAWEIPSSAADTVGKLLDFASLLVGLAAIAWWLARDRAIRAGRAALADADLGRDFVFAIVLLLVLVSRVLSPQYMLWLLGMAAIVLTAPASRLRRPAWIVLGALIITPAAYGSAGNIVIRDVALLVAAVDACLTLYFVLARPEAGAAGMEESQPLSSPAGSSSAQG